MALPRLLKLMNVFNNGFGYEGVAEEVELPKLTMKSEDFRAGGMLGEVTANLGLEKLEMTHKYAGIVPELFKGFATDTIDSELIRFAGSYQRDDTGEITAVEVLVRGRHTELDGGSSKTGEKTETTIKSALSYYKLTVDGKELIEIDLINSVFKVDGKDRYAQHRAAIGL
ncbi:phage major tail tube protein [Glaesserella parasuis]|uniref:Phage major tail tube protein n=1 Tax=Glaesserella parasuis TaxID=738 RepID=A0A859IHW8_GLAPU|nr:phage major tail tube protein [Glaesserella parasuis]MDG6327702.1 phage major tail tube protein [Glaesserella parasuis]MDO9700138.1 phage major tail tube protein [Glaesserella parasuis]MDP0054629.1 phage major tail tube protein [Glaesserella parasuis]MDP0266901.1 phage major tail tube protein [Glaesserella parasuis]MDP0337579.1 phage major tail tube protein [Glaesserella parasuis]